VIRLVQLSDPHLLSGPGPDGDEQLKKGVRPNARFKRAVAQVARMDPPPACCVITGDLVADETPAHYAQLKTLCQELPGPLHFALGNHDDRRLFWEAFGAPASRTVGGDERHCYTFALDDEGTREDASDGQSVRCWILDSHLDGEVAGALGPEQLQWLAEGLRAPANIADVHLVFVHHPAVPLGGTWMDDMLLRDGDALIEVLTGSGAPIGRVLFGHVHQPITATVAGLTLSSAPSTGYQFTDDEVTPQVYPGTAGYHVITVDRGRVITTVVPIIDDADASGGDGA
jgi:Icc protein